MHRGAPTLAGRIILALALTACLGDGPSEPGALAPRLAIAAQVGEGDGSGVRVTISYAWAEQEPTVLAVRTLPIVDGQASGALTVSIEQCLREKPGSVDDVELPDECPLIVDLELLDESGTVVDDQTLGTVHLGPGETATVGEGVVLAAGIEYPTFEEPDRLILVGSASTGGEGALLRLTQSVEGQAGAAWFERPRHLADGFESTFDFRIGGAMPCVFDEGGQPGGDGIAFVIQRVGTSAIGAAGGGIGYHEMPASLAVELDTWWNAEFEATGNHIAVHTNGLAANSALSSGIASATPNTNLSDGEIHTVVIRYVPGTLEVLLDGILVVTAPITLTDIDGESLLDGDGRAWVGFTAATGMAFETHDVLSWRLGAPGTGTC